MECELPQVPGRVMKRQSHKTTLRHLKQLLKRSENEDFTTLSEDQALREVIEFLEQLV